MLEGFTVPHTPTGRSSLVTAPPWHYAGRVASFACELDADTAQRFLPPDFGHATGRAYGHFCDWQATTDGSELLDPAYALYAEYFHLLEAERDGELRLFCPFIYVDQDIALVRGLLQGWPKKLGSVRIARSMDLDHPAAGCVRAGTTLGATLAVKDRRLVEASWRFTGEPGERLGFLATPTFGVVASPTLVGGADRGRGRLVRQDVSRTVVGPVHGATGELRLLDAPRDELGELAPSATVRASVCELALTVDGVVEAA